MTERQVRRHYDSLIEKAGGNCESAMFDALADLDEKIERLQSTINSHIENEDERLKQVEYGFAEGGPSEHRKYHEALIAKIRARTEFWQRLAFELAKWGLIGFLGWASYSLWGAFLKGPK